MITVQLEISEELAEKVGIETLVERFKQDMELEKLRLLAERIQQGIQTAHVNNQQLAKSARHKAWQSFKKRYLGDILP